jgi:uncharacterized protein YdeI (YjbR/CyaY-like superfamily)
LRSISLSEAPEHRFFEDAAGFRAWLAEHHETAPELILAYRRRGSGMPSITWPESVDVALCFGWIDGVRRGVDDTTYTIRFTPRRATSIWSAVNVRRFAELTAEGLVAEAGRRAFAARREDRTAVYTHEQAVAPALDAAFEERFRATAPDGWAWFEAQAPYYRRQAAHWVMSAKRPETRERRLAMLIADSTAGLRVGPLRR